MKKTSFLILLLLVIKFQAQVMPPILDPDHTFVFASINAPKFEKKIDWEKLKLIFEDDDYDFDPDGNFEVNKEKTFSFLELSEKKFIEAQYIYGESFDSIYAINMLFKINDLKKFTAHIKETYVNKKNKIKTNKEYSYIDDGLTYIGWNKKTAFYSIPNVKDPYFYDVAPADTAIAIAVDSVVATLDFNEIDTVTPDADTLPYYKEEIIQLNEDIAYFQQRIDEVKKDIAYLETYHKYPLYADSTTIDDTATIDDTLTFSRYDDAQNVQEMQYAQKLFDTYFSSRTAIIPERFIHKKDENADINIWYNLQKLYTVENYYTPLDKFLSMFDVNGIDHNINIYNEQGFMRGVSYSHMVDPKYNQHFLNLYNQKLDTRLLPLLNNQQLGAVSLNCNPKESFNLLYEILNHTNLPNEETKETQSFRLLVETFKLALDEDAIARIMPSSALFTLNSLKSKEVSYLDYEYNETMEDYKEVKKFKTIQSPEFNIAFAINDTAYWTKILAYIKEIAAKEDNINVKAIENGYYLKLNEDDYIDGLYVSIKDDILLITTDNTQITKLNDNINKLDETIKTKFLQHNSYGYLNLENLLFYFSEDVIINNPKLSETYKKLTDGLKLMEFYTDVEENNLKSISTIQLNKGLNHLSFIDYVIDLIGTEKSYENYKELPPPPPSIKIPKETPEEE